MPPRNIFGTSIKYTLACRSNIPPTLVAVELNIKSEEVPYIRMASTPYRFIAGRPDKMLRKFDFNDMDVDPKVFGSFGRFHS